MKEENCYIVNTKNTDIENLSTDISVLNEYSNALELLDDYDHQCVNKPKGNPNVKELSYEECCKIISKIEYDDNTKIFRIEEELGKLKKILEAVHQSVYEHGQYPTLEEKASTLLYFFIKDPHFSNCKKIGATLFLEFLNKNNVLFNEDGAKIISESDLVSITLMIAQSEPKEKEIMIRLIMNFLHIYNM